MTEEEGRECGGRKYVVTDGGKDQKWNISNYQLLNFLQYTETFIIRVPAGKLRRFQGFQPRRTHFAATFSCIHH